MSAFRLIRYGRKTLRHLYGGLIGTYIDPVAAWYDEQGYGRSYAVASLKSVDRFGRWLDRKRVKLCDVNEQLIARYVLQCPKRSHPGTHAALRRLLVVLRIPAMADTSTGDGGQRRSVATQVGRLFIRLSGMLQGRALFAHRLS
jgi:hypothetical protein